MRCFSKAPGFDEAGAGKGLTEYRASPQPYLCEGRRVTGVPTATSPRKEKV